jgi:hypothetical protein
MLCEAIVIRNTPEKYASRSSGSDIIAGFHLPKPMAQWHMKTAPSITAAGLLRIYT